MTPDTEQKPSSPIRYAVVGLGHIAQNAILPAFRNARENSRLAAMFSGDEEKRRQLSKKHRVPAMPYEQYDEFLASGQCDAVFIALPNHLHRDYTERAARAGVHVLCEKPMAVTEEDCEAMNRACADSDVKLMIAYRLHFEAANLTAIEIVQSGQIGEARMFNSTFCMQADDENIRLEKELGGGVLHDIGIYCINAARYIFYDEPTEVFASKASNPDDPRFDEVAEMFGVTMRFPKDRLATFIASFGAPRVANYQVMGTKGDIRLDPAYGYQSGLKLELTIDGKTTRKSFPKRDQFAPEIIRFSQSILNDRDPEPSGIEGLADVRIIEALLQSARDRAPVKLSPYLKPRRPSPEQELHRSPAPTPALVKAESPAQD